MAKRIIERMAGQCIIVRAVRCFKRSRTDRLVSLCRHVLVGGRQLHDATSVATMLAYGERSLLTFNADDFRRYGDRIELIMG